MYIYTYMKYIYTYTYRIKYIHIYYNLTRLPEFLLNEQYFHYQDWLDSNL